MALSSSIVLSYIIGSVVSVSVSASRSSRSIVVTGGFDVGCAIAMRVLFLWLSRNAMAAEKARNTPPGRAGAGARRNERAGGAGGGG
jgi:hypothetical protein